ncbi:hypothetical protein J4E08_09930 [Sagittula sp. NFXS13]
MTDLERVALGVALVETVLNPVYSPAVIHAARTIREHGEALQDAQWRAVCAAANNDTSHTSVAASTGQSTHGAIEQMATPEISGPPIDAGKLGRPGRSFSSSLRSAWARFSAAEKRLSQSWWGDGLAGLSFAILCICLMFAPLIWS